MFTQLLDYIKTTDDLEKLESELSLLRELMYTDPENYLAKSESKLRFWIYDYLSENKEKGLNIELLNEITDQLKNIERVDIIISFEPTQGFINRMYDNLQLGFGKKIIINLIFDPTIIGGAVFVFRGLYRDYSLKEAFNLELEKSRETIMEVIKDKSY